MARNKYVILRIFIIHQPFYDAYVYVKFRRIFTNANKNWILMKDFHDWAVY